MQCYVDPGTNPGPGMKRPRPIRLTRTNGDIIDCGLLGPAMCDATANGKIYRCYNPLRPTEAPKAQWIGDLVSHASKSRRDARIRKPVLS